VSLDDRSAITGVAIFSADEIEQLADSLAGVTAVAVDAPAQVSSAPHRGEHSLKAKFKAARCAEIALGRDYGSWVPWVAPIKRPTRGWIATGFALYDALASRGVQSLEVYPYAGYRYIWPGRLPKKTTVDGVRARVQALRGVGVEQTHMEMWSHDGLDAALAAVIARDFMAGKALRVGCGHDDSAIWLPSLPGS
jgi:predicted nuclease with RNAse H fold